MTPLIFSVFAMGFATIWYNHRQFLSAGLFAISYSSAALAFGIEALTTDLGSTSGISYIGDLLYVFSAFMLILAVCEKFGGKLPMNVLSVIAAVLFATATWYRFIDYNIELRVQWISIGCGILLLTGAFHIRSEIYKPVDRVIFWLLVLFGTQFFVTTLATLQLDDEVLTSSNFSGSFFFTAMNFIVSALALSLAVTLLIKFGMDIIKGLQGQTRTDELSGLLNRRGFENEMRMLLSEREIPDACSALIVCDLDHFKKVNDNFGHQVGDQAIAAFADIIKKTSRKSDLLGRIGGEEFCMFLPGATDTEAAEIAEEVRHAFSKKQINGVAADFPLTASFGVAHCRGANYHTLFRRADAALYRAKQLGRDRVEADSARTTIVRKVDQALVS